MFNIGDYVKLKNSTITGKIINKNDKCYKIQLLNNSTVIYVSDDKIEEYNYEKIKPSIKINYSLCENNNDNTDIMLRHQTKLEALENLDRFIFSSIAAHQKRIRIIHGRNGGILREAVHDYLKKSPYVESFHIADNKEGSVGVTVAYLK